MKLDRTIQHWTYKSEEKPGQDKRMWLSYILKMKKCYWALMQISFQDIGIGMQHVNYIK